MLRNSALTLTHRIFADALAKATRAPLAEDFFAWAADTDTYPHVRWALDVNCVRYEPSMRLDDLKAVIQRREEGEIAKGERRHWSFDVNRLVTWRDILRAIEQFQKRGM